MSPDLFPGLYWPWLLFSLALGYLLGSIPFGLILTRLAGLGDIRNIGSGNIGATNVLRTGNRKVAAATLVLDALKGVLAVLIAGWLAGHGAAVVAGLGAVLGHLFPIWLGFKGGKGVATTLGVFFGLAWPIAVIACLLWLAIAAIFRMSSLAALLALGLACVAAWLLADVRALGLTWSTVPVAVLATVLTPLVWAMHHENIARLLKGQEPRIGAS